MALYHARKYTRMKVSPKKSIQTFFIFFETGMLCMNAKTRKIVVTRIIALQVEVARSGV